MFKTTRTCLTAAYFNIQRCFYVTVLSQPDHLQSTWWYHHDGEWSSPHIVLQMVVSEEVQFSRQDYVFLEWIKICEEKLTRNDSQILQPLRHVFFIQLDHMRGARPLVPYSTIIQHILTTVTTTISADMFKMLTSVDMKVLCFKH